MKVSEFKAWPAPEGPPAVRTIVEIDDTNYARIRVFIGETEHGLSFNAESPENVDGSLGAERNAFERTVEFLGQVFADYMARAPRRER